MNDRADQVAKAGAKKVILGEYAEAVKQVDHRDGCIKLLSVAGTTLARQVFPRVRGAERVAARLGRWRSTGRWPRCPVGINLGKSRVVSLEEAAADYAASFRALREFGDYFAVNVSSPNTPGLRELQAASHLREILRAIARENSGRRPVLVKLAPDLSDDQWAGIVAAGEEEGAAGWIATNTTLDHTAIPSAQNQEGGLSGEPLRTRATEVVRKLASLSSLPVIGVGGVSSVASAREKMAAGARLVQLYTGLVYEGPRLPARIVSGLD
jgi:dihydroorotate dehydrogenase